MFHGHSGSSNGHYRAGQQREGRPRRGRGGPGGGFRASHHGQQFQERNPVRRCTEYDKAYFQAYSDIGIHEEMIKGGYLASANWNGLWNETMAIST